MHGKNIAFAADVMQTMPRKPIAINGREIGPHLPPYLIAEISGNHNGSLRQVKWMINEARECGADAVKLQAYTPGELTSPRHADLWRLYERAQTPRERFPELFDHARQVGITIFSSAFSVDGVKFLKKLGSPAIKIASAEVRDGVLIQTARETGLPLIISTGMATEEDINLLPAGAILLHCVAQYPSRIEDANLRAIKRMYDDGDRVGLSDHTPGYETTIAATALGAVMIEKHFKMDENCIDAAWSLDPTQFAAMCKAVRSIWTGMGDGLARVTCEGRQR